MTSELCSFHLKDACKRGSFCTFRHQKPIVRTKPFRSSGICRYSLIGTCVFGDRCKNSHRGELTEANNNYNKGGSKSNESPVENNGISPSHKGSAGEEGEDVQDSGLKEIEEYAESDIQDSGPSRGDLLDPRSSNIKIDEENADRQPCIFFFEGSCNNSPCEFSHSIPKHTESSSGFYREPTNFKPSYSPKPSGSPRRKSCKFYRQGCCQEKDCKFLHPQSQTKSLITSPDTSTDLFCRLGSPLDRPNGGEDDKTSLEAHLDETEGDINVVDDEAQDRTDRAPSYYNDESNGNHADPGQPTDNYQEQLNDAHEIEGDVIDNVVDDETQNKTDQGEAYQEQLNDGPFDHRTNNTDNHFVEETVETYPNHVEIVNKRLKTSKRASYYGDGCEESSPPPSLATQLPQRQRTAPPVPHILNIIPHWTQFADPNAKKDVPFCKQLAQGGCSQDDKCRFRHSLTVEEYVLLFNDQQPNLWTLQHYDVNEAAIFSPSCEPQADSPDSSSTVVPKSSIFGQECKFYPIGKCRNGHRCPFLHTQHPPVQATTVSNADQTSERPVFGTQNSQRPCKIYAERGYCRWDVSCKFRHSDHPNDDRPSEPSGPEWTSAVDDGKGGSTSWGEGNQANNNIPDPDTPEDDGWGATAATEWDPLSIPEDRSAWDNPGRNEDSHKSRPRNCFQNLKGLCNRGMTCKFSHDQEYSNKQLSSEAPKADDGGWPPTDDWQPTNESEETVQNEWGTEGEPKTLSENQPKAQEQGFQDSNIIDNEATWSQSWTETVQPPSFPKKIDAPCMRFGQGYCPYEDDCNYLHIEDTDIAEDTINSEENNSNIPLANEEVAEAESIVHDEPDSGTMVELEPIIFDHPVVERHLLNCTVCFGINATPDQITTAAESKKLVLSNLPVHVMPADIEELAGPFGEIHSIISLDETAHTARIEVEFAKSSQALSAFKHVNGQNFESHTISANLKGRISMAVRSPEHTHVVKVSWPAPSASAWIHYTSVSKAKSEAIRLDCVIIGGLPIKAIYVPPLKRQKDSFAVEIRGLPVDISKDVLKELCPEGSFINMNPPCYTQDPTNAIWSALARYGELEDVDIPAATRLTSVVAFATLKSRETAEEAMKALDGRNQDFLGGQPLSVRPVYYFRHRATIPQFEAVKNEIDRLNGKGEKKCSIQYQEQHERGIVWIRIHASAENLATFVSMNTELAALLRGMLLTSNGVVWTDYLETSSSARAIEGINTNNSEGPFFVQCDNRTRNVRIFGGKPDQERAQTLVMRMLQKVNKLQHEIQLPRTKLRDLVSGGLKALQDNLGVNKVSLDVVNAKLIARGSAGDNLNIQDYVRSLDSLSTPETTEALCQICHHLPVDPILLTCRHAYCTPCLQMALQYSPSAPFQCISQNTLEDGLTTQCPANVPYVVIRDILPTAEEKRFLQASFLSYVRSQSEELFFCPTLDCQSAYRTGSEGLVLKCSICVSEMCSFCQTRAHVGSACKGKQELI